MQLDDIDKLVLQLAHLLIDNNQSVCTAESCTGGLIAKTFTDLAGSSVWFDRGFVTYSNQAKADMLGVHLSIIDAEGAVSEPVVVEMAKGALKNSEADFSISVTGVAGPGGGSPAKPVGTVWIGVASGLEVNATRYQFDGDRNAVRQLTLVQAIHNLIDLIE